MLYDCLYFLSHATLTRQLKSEERKKEETIFHWEWKQKVRVAQNSQLKLLSPSLEEES